MRRKNKNKKKCKWKTWEPSSKAREDEEKFLKRTKGGNFDRHKIFDEPRRESLGTAWGIGK